MPERGKERSPGFPNTMEQYGREHGEVKSFKNAMTLCWDSAAALKNGSAYYQHADLLSMEKFRMNSVGQA